MCGPGKENRVSQASERFTVLFGCGYGVSEKLGSAALELGDVGGDGGVVGGVVTVVVAVGEGGEGEVGDGGFVAHATVEEDTGGEGDVDAGGGEALSELNGRVDVALYRVSHKDEAVLRHCSGGA